MSRQQYDELEDYYAKKLDSAREADRKTISELIAETNKLEQRIEELNVSRMEDMSSPSTTRSESNGKRVSTERKLKQVTTETKANGYGIIYMLLSFILGIAVMIVCVYLKIHEKVFK